MSAVESSPPDAKAGPESGTESGHVELEGKDLPAFCPNPKMALWDHHPRVYLDVAPTGEAMCPYCGTRYRLKPGTVVRSH